MRENTYLPVVALATLLLVFAGSTAADTVVVTQGDLVPAGSATGWCLASRRGTALNPEDKQVGEFWVGPAGPPSGNGSFHMDNPYSYTDPVAKIYLGTNNHSGLALSRITSLKYYTYLRSRGHACSGQPLGHPPMIELITDGGGTRIQQRIFVYKPYGELGRPSCPAPPDAPDSQARYWQEHDLMAENGRWEQWMNSVNVFGNWNWVKSKYVDQWLDTPLVGDYQDGWNKTDPTHWMVGNQAGTSIAIRTGVGQARYKYYDGGLYIPTWRESADIDACFDKFVIGIDGVETVYDFEPPPLHTPVGMTNKAAHDNIMAKARQKFLVVLWGSVLSDQTFGPNTFTLDDGSGATIKTSSNDGHIATVGNYVRAKGLLDTTVTPRVLYSSMADITVLQW